MSRARTPPDPEAQHTRQQAREQARQATGTAMAHAADDMPSLGELQSTEFIDTAFDPDVNRGEGVPGKDDNHLEEKFAAEFGRHAGLGNISREEWERWQLMNKARGILAKQEMARPNGLGSKCSPQLREEMTGLDEELPMRTDDMAREIEATFEEKSRLESLSVDARGFRGLTEVQTVNRQEGNEIEASSGGLVSRATNFLFGG